MRHQFFQTSELHDDSIQVEVPMVVLIAGGCINVIKDRDGISDYPSSSYAEFWSYDGNHCSLPNMISTRNEHYQSGELGIGSNEKPYFMKRMMYPRICKRRGTFFIL